MRPGPSKQAGGEGSVFCGRHGQDRWFAEILRNSGGYFVELGAGDGLSGSNSCWYERQGWQGLCLEEGSDRFGQLASNRNCLLHAGPLGGEAGRTLEAVLDEVEAPVVIDYLTIRGSVPAPEVLRELGWGTRWVRAIGIEHGGSEERSEAAHSLLEARGYVRCGFTDHDDYYLLQPKPEGAPGPAQLALFAEYHRFGNEVRDAEIEGALRDCLELGFVQRLYLFHGDAAPRTITGHEKCTVVPGERRRTIQELFAYADEVSPVRCRVLINSDIVLDDDCFRLPFLIGTEEFYALRRLEEDGRLNPRGGLDAWCWADRCRIVGADFEMGRVNCDLRLNHLAYEAYGEGFSCPSRTFTIHHRHASQIRPGTSNLARRDRYAVPGAGRPVASSAHPIQVAVEAAVRPERRGGR